MAQPLSGHKRKPSAVPGTPIGRPIKRSRGAEKQWGGERPDNAALRHGNFDLYRGYDPVNPASSSGKFDDGRVLCDPRLDEVSPHHFRGANVLEIGCGAGYLCLQMSEKLRAASVLGIDIDQPLIHKARELLDYRRLAHAGTIAPTSSVSTTFAKSTVVGSAAAATLLAAGGLPVSTLCSQRWRRPPPTALLPTAPFAARVGVAGSGGGASMTGRGGVESSGRYGRSGSVDSALTSTSYPAAVPLHLRTIAVPTPTSLSASGPPSASIGPESSAGCSARFAGVGAESFVAVDEARRPHGALHYFERPGSSGAALPGAPTAVPESAQPPTAPIAAEAEALARLARVRFLCQDVLSSGGWGLPAEHFDVLVCFNVTKYVHLNGGDDAVRRLLVRCYELLKPGGRLLLIAQPWPSYKKHRHLCLSFAASFGRIRFKPAEFLPFLLEEVGFTHLEAAVRVRKPVSGGTSELLVLRK